MQGVQISGIQYNIYKYFDCVDCTDMYREHGGAAREHDLAEEGLAQVEVGAEDRVDQALLHAVILRADDLCDAW